MAGMKNYRIWLAVTVAIGLGFGAGRLWPGPSDQSGRYGVILDQTTNMSDDEREEVIAALRHAWAKQREYERIIHKYSEAMKQE
jgi:hypothetical protein